MSRQSGRTSWANAQRRDEGPPDGGTGERAAAFVFTGPGRLTLRGPQTGIEYRFASGGPSVRVHPSDVAPLSRFPGLEAVA